jgi:hypothetical protein
VLDATKYAVSTKDEQRHASGRLLTGDLDIEDVEHITDPELCTDSKAEI